MKVREVDPRDIEREMTAVYRVYFWSAGRTMSDEVVVDGCEVGRGAVLGSAAAYLIGPLDHTGAT